MIYEAAKKQSSHDCNSVLTSALVIGTIGIELVERFNTRPASQPKW